MNLRTSSIVLFAALAAPAALAGEFLYRSTMPNGDILYGESPAPGAKQVRKIPAPPTTTGTVIITNEDKSRASGIAPPPPGGVAILPTQKREATTSPATAGSTVSTDSLPRSAY